MDLADTIIPRSDQLNAEDFLTGPRTVTITEVRVGSSPDQPVSVFLAEFPRDRPFKPSKTVRRIMVLGWGPDSAAHVGKRMTLYRDPAVRFGGQDVGGIRVSHMSGITRRLEVALAVTRGKREQYTVEPLAGDAPSPLDALVFAFNTAGVTEPRARLAYCRDVVRRELRSAKDLTPDEVTAVIAALNPVQVPDEPEPAHQNEKDHMDDAARRQELEIPDPMEPTDAEIEAARQREAEQHG
jgi:hypothetical protein